MTGTHKASTRVDAFGKMPNEAGHGGPPNVVNGSTGSGECDSGLVEGSGYARAPTRSLPLTTATQRAEGRLSLEPWPLTVRDHPGPGAGPAGHRSSTQEANDGRVA